MEGLTVYHSSEIKVKQRFDTSQWRRWLQIGKGPIHKHTVNALSQLNRPVLLQKLKPLASPTSASGRKPHFLHSHNSHSIRRSSYNTPIIILVVHTFSLVSFLLLWRLEGSLPCRAHQPSNE